MCIRGASALRIWVGAYLGRRLCMGLGLQNVCAYWAG